MKRILGLLSIIFILAGCRPEGIRYDVSQSRLSVIDTLMQSQPDSALTLLMDTTMQGPYYQLLLSEALYKNDYAQANRAELLDAMAYFDSIGDPFLSARCHYMNGVGYYELDSVVPACAEYLKALEIMEDNFKKKELVGYKAKLMALTNTHLCKLFSDQYLPEQSLYFGKHSLQYYNNYSAEPWHVAWMLDEIGMNYDLLERWDSADYYYSKAIDFLPDTNNLTYRDAATGKTFLSYTKDKTFQYSINRLRVLLASSESEDEYLSRCLCIGDIYYREKEWDSARFYLNKVFCFSNSINSRILSAQHLREISITIGDSLSINDYTYFLSQHANVGDLQASLHSQLTDLQRSFEQNRKNRLHLTQQEELIKRSVIVATVLLTTAFVILGLLIANKKRLKSERHAHKMHQAALSRRLKNSNKTLKYTTKQLADIIELKSSMIDLNGMTPNINAFMSSPICHHILSVVERIYFKPKIDYHLYQDYALDRKQLKALVDSADLHLVQFTIRLKKQYPALTKDDMVYCCLYLLGLNEADISALMQRAYSTVCERNRKIKRILNVENELSTALQDFIINN